MKAVAYNWKTHATLVVLLMAIMALRFPALVEGGHFTAEDGRVFFAEAWSLPLWESLLTPYAGYFHLLPRILAELLSPLPLVWLPATYSLISLGLTAGTLSVFYLPGFRALVKLDGNRLGVCLLLGIAPHAENLGFLFGLHWYLAFALTLFLVMEPPTGRVGYRVLLLVSILIIWSSPSAFVLVPLILWKWINAQDKRTRFFLLSLLVNLGLVFGFVLVFRIQGEDRTALFTFPDLLAALDRMVLRGWLGTTWIGRGNAAWIATYFPPLLYAIAALTTGAGLGLLWKHRSSEQTKAAILILLAALGMIALSLTRSLYLAEMTTLDLPRHTRYLTAPSLLLLITPFILIPSTYWNKPWRTMGVFTPLVLLLVSGSTGEIHWAKPAQEFRIGSYVEDIRQFEISYVRERRPGNLYIPHDIPYDGPILSSEPGITHLPEEGLSPVAQIEQGGTTAYSAWIESLAMKTTDTRVEMPGMGLMQYLGYWGGCLWFEDEAGALLFTSRLLYPQMCCIQEDQFLLIPLPSG